MNTNTSDILALCGRCGIDATPCVDGTGVVADLRHYGLGIVLLASTEQLRSLLNG